jgi:hypothetical protein
MNAALLTPSKYIKAVALQGRDKTVTITGVKLEELEREDGTKEARGLISIAETTKRWVLNVTNVKSLVALFGTETNDWLGKKVTLFPEPNSMSDSGVAIRVRGSPDIAKDITFTLKLARKKPRQVVLRKTIANGNGAKTAPSPAGDPAPVSDEDSFGDPPDGGPGLEPLPGGQPL